MNHLAKETRLLFWVLVSNFVLFGITLTIIGATIPEIIRGFNWSYTVTGMVLASGSVGYFSSSFLSGFLLKRFGSKRILVSGLFLEAIGLLLFARHPSVLFNLSLTFILGVGQGGTETVTNVSVIQMEKEGESRLMNLMHAAFCVGAIIGPFITGMLIATGRWQIAYRLSASACFLMGVLFLFLSFAHIRQEKLATKGGGKTLSLLFNPLIVLLFLVLFLYVGTELGTSAWVAEYYVEILKTSSSVGAYIISLFWTGLLLGRLSISFWYKERSPSGLLIFLASLCTIALLCAVSVKNPWFAGFSFFMAGLGYSAIYPVVMALVGQHFQQGQSVVVGFVAMGGGIGSFMFPFLMAFISDHLGLRQGFLFYVGIDVLMVVLTIVVKWLIRAQTGVSER
ncbi:MFS transporter [bacterium]|nr:MFS transporter [bacterium]